MSHALAMSGEMNRVIATADVKAGLVLTTVGVVLAVTTASLRSAPPQTAGLRVVTVVVVILAGVGVLLLGVTLWPRLDSSASAWLALPDLRVEPTGAVAHRPSAAVMADQAWVQAAALAGIARRKYRWFRAAVVVAVVDLAFFLVWVFVTALD